jgi:hypothetical protein
MWGTDAPTYALDRTGLSAFVLEDGVVYTYSTFVRGLDSLGHVPVASTVPRRNVTRRGAWFRP